MARTTIKVVTVQVPTDRSLIYDDTLPYPYATMLRGTSIIQQESPTHLGHQAFALLDYRRRAMEIPTIAVIESGLLLFPTICVGTFSNNPTVAMDLYVENTELRDFLQARYTAQGAPWPSQWTWIVGDYITTLPESGGYETIVWERDGEPNMTIINNALINVSPVFYRNGTKYVKPSP